MLAAHPNGGVPALDTIDRIAAIDDPVLRNLEITLCYARLSAAMAARTGECSNWCTFATWASRQAGATIRGEDLLDSFARRLRRRAELLHPFRSAWRALLRRGLFRPETRIGRLVRAVHTPFDAFERTSAAVARGNLKVFAEIGREFARYLAVVDPDDRIGDAPFVRFLEGLRPGDPPDGQDYLKRAFTRYQQQRFEPDASARAEFVALANLEIGLHEQTRLQPEIRESLDAPLATKRDLRGRVLDALLPARGFWRGVLKRGPFGSSLAALAAPVARFAEHVSREAITERLMVLTLPGRTLPLGQPLDAPMPAPFRSPASAELQAFVARFETCSPEGPASSARDWSELSQRMHYILHLFCAYHESRDLHRAPFTDEEIRQIASGHVPHGAV